REKERQDKARLEREQREREEQERRGKLLQRLTESMRFEPVPKPTDERLHGAYTSREFYEILLERLGEQWRDCGLGKRHDKRVGETCQAWLKVFSSIRSKLGNGFLYLLTGNRGTGKTQMAANLCRISIERGLANHGSSAKYVTAMQLFLSIRKTFKNDSRESEADIIERYSATPFLVIDEIQERTGTDFENRILTMIVDQRYAEQRDTLLIGNIEMADVSQVLGASVTSRLNEAGGVIVTSWPSFRESTP
ncbi:MAG: ATP-binding protein, partial [Lentisphaerota bacterium]